MNDADTTEQQVQEPSTVEGGDELKIPKHRFDEVLDTVKGLREENQMLKQVIQQNQPKAMTQNEDEAFNWEAEGVDPQTGKVLERVVQKRIEAERKRLNPILGHFGNKLEENEFVAAHGSDKRKHLSKIREYQRDHFNQTGSRIDVETAYKLYTFDQMSKKPKQEPVVKSDPEETPKIKESGPSQTAVKKTFEDLSIEEMEAQLGSKFPQNGL